MLKISAFYLDKEKSFSMFVLIGSIICEHLEFAKPYGEREILGHVVKK